jgi:hypothetical protein
MQTNPVQPDPHENFLSPDTEVGFTGSEDALREDEADDWDELWEKYEDDDF